MKVDQNSTVGGLQLIEVRRFLREVRQGYKATTEVGNVGTFFKIGTREAQTILRALIDAGYLTPEQPYGITRTGIGLCTTRFVPRINRAKADKIVVDLLQRVDAVNARDELTDRVKSVHAFGSYITDTDDLGDVDVAITLERRIEDFDQYLAATFSRADAVNRRMSYVDRLNYGEAEVERILKNRNRHLSIHSLSEVEKIGTPYRQIFPSEQ